MLVLLVVFIVTAKLIVARGVEIDKPKAATGGEVQSTLRVSVDARTASSSSTATSSPTTRTRSRGSRQIAATTTKPKAIIAGDRKSAYGGVMHAIDLVQQAGVTAIALENERP